MSQAIRILLLVAAWLGAACATPGVNVDMPSAPRHFVVAAEETR